MLFPINIVDAGLQICNLFKQSFPFFGKNNFSFRNRCFAQQAQIDIRFHLLNTHTTVFQTGQTFDPCHITVIKYAIIIGITLHIGHKPHITIKFKRLIGHTGFTADISHCIHKNSFSISVKNPEQ